MELIRFNEWKNIRESREQELKCPHPEDKEYCKKWNLWIKGELSSMPVHQGRASIGHYKGPRAGTIQTKKDRQRRESGRKGGRYDWRRQN